MFVGRSEAGWSVISDSVAGANFCVDSVFGVTYCVAPPFPGGNLEICFVRHRLQSKVVAFLDSLFALICFCVLLMLSMLLVFCLFALEFILVLCASLSFHSLSYPFEIFIFLL